MPLEESYINREGISRVLPGESFSIAYMIYQSAFENSHCKKIGDGSFFDVKRT